MLVKAEKLPEITLHSVSKSRRTYFLLYNNPQSVKKILILFFEEDKVSRRKPLAKFHDPSEILRMSDPLFFCKAKGSFHRDLHEY